MQTGSSNCRGVRTMKYSSGCTRNKGYMEWLSTRSKILVGVITCLLFLTITFNASADTQTENWSNFKADEGNTGTTSNTIYDYYELAWKFQDSFNTVPDSPAIHENAIYHSISKNNTLYKIDLVTGEINWTFHGDEEGGENKYISLPSSPAVYDGIVFVGMDNGYLYAVDSETGEELWNFGDTDSPVASSPIVVNDILYFGGAWTATLYALDPYTGEEIWTFETDGGISSSPAVEGDIVYIADWDGNVYALDAEGNNDDLNPLAWGTTDLIWKWDGEDFAIDGSTAVADGVVVISPGYALFGLDAQTGEQLWEYGCYSDEDTPAIYNGTILAGCISGDIHSIDLHTGELKWFFEFPRGRATPSIVVSENSRRILASGGLDTIYILDFSSGEIIWRYQVGPDLNLGDYNIFRNSPSVYGDYIVISDWDGYLYVFKQTDPPSEDENDSGYPEIFSFIILSFLSLIVIIILSLPKKMQKN